MRIFTRTYDAMKAEIASKRAYTATMTYICIGLIIACSVLVSPFTLKITGRTNSLINLFLDFSRDEIDKNVLSVEDFITYLNNETKDQIENQLKENKKRKQPIAPRKRKTSKKVMMSSIKK